MAAPEVGEKWAYREKARTMGDPVRPVEVLQHGPPRSRRLRIRWLDGEYAGMDQWIPEVRLIVRWDHAERFVDDEQRLLELWALQLERADQAVVDAVAAVWFSSDDDSLDFDIHGRGAIELTVASFHRHADTIPVPEQELLASPGAHVDSHGDLHVGQEAAIAVAQALCKRSPERVLAHVDAEVDRLRRAALTGWYDSKHISGGGYRIDTDRAWELLPQTEATATIVRDWCGAPARIHHDELVELRAEVRRLGILIEKTADWLKHSGHPQKAALVLKEWRAAG